MSVENIIKNVFTYQVNFRRSLSRRNSTLGTCVDFNSDFDPLPTDYDGPRYEGENDELDDPLVRRIQLYFANEKVKQAATKTSFK